MLARWGKPNDLAPLLGLDLAVEEHDIIGGVRWAGISSVINSETGGVERNCLVIPYDAVCARGHGCADKSH